MNIDRHNYEEFFLLYVDNELNVDQKKQVELFVQQHPDLEEEFIMLQQSKLVADETIVFEDKQVLMKGESHGLINMNNYETWLVLYVDEELNDEERKSVEEFANAHPHVKEELGLFQQTKLQPEIIRFENKSSLYKKEETVRVITMSWWRVAVAAMLIIAAGITTYSVFNNSAVKDNSTAVVNPVKTEEINGSKVEDSQKENPNPDKLTTNAGENLATVAAATPGVKKVKIENSEPENKYSTDKKITDENKMLASVDKQDIVTSTEETKRTIISTGIDIPDTRSSDVNTAVAIDEKLDKQIFNNAVVTETPDETHIEYASNTDKKVRGFFRKATRFIERTTNINPVNDDNKLLIGGMAINLK